ncbi:MAG TPA: hypothetical protein VL404_03975 [Candidatus Eisenbacteria bacterium]|nr:hypothetical protein [Candidatus Eisenbacteria bacterium]
MTVADEQPKKPKPDAVRDFLANRVKPAFEKAVNTINAMNAREKTMIIGFAALLVIALDYWVLIRPITQVFGTTLPELAGVESQAEGLRADKRNKDLIGRSWEETHQDLLKREKSFIAPDELPRLLENLSELAQNSGVKILTLIPVEIAPSAAAGDSRYRKAAIRLSAMAGTHEFGRFLANLEGGTTYFRVTNLSIKDTPDLRRHQMELDLELYTYGSTPAKRG